MILSCENLSFSYGTHEVLREVRFGVEKGEKARCSAAYWGR